MVNRRSVLWAAALAALVLSALVGPHAVRTVMAVAPTHAIVKATEGQWAVAECYNGSTEVACVEEWVIGAGTENPASGFGGTGALFWRTDEQRFSVKGASTWALFERAAQPFGISVFDLRQTTGIPLVAAETAGNFDITVGTNLVVANGEVTDNETEASITYFEFRLPENYVAAGDVTIRLRAALVKTGSPTDNGSTLDISVYEQADGAVGSDICATAAATFAALDTWYNKDFVVTATDLVAGDKLLVKITSSVIDSEAGAGTIILNLESPTVLLDIR